MFELCGPTFLARALPVFRGLVKMHLTLRREQEKLAIGRSLRAWPLPKLKYIYKHTRSAVGGKVQLES